MAKRPTKVLREKGFETLQVQKGVFGFYLHDTRYSHQRSTCYSTGQGAIDAALRGELPVDLAALRAADGGE